MSRPGGRLDMTQLGTTRPQVGVFRPGGRREWDTVLSQAFLWPILRWGRFCKSIAFSFSMTHNSTVGVASHHERQVVILCSRYWWYVHVGATIASTGRTIILFEQPDWIIITSISVFRFRSPTPPPCHRSMIPTMHLTAFHRGTEDMFNQGGVFHFLESYIPLLDFVTRIELAYDHVYDWTPCRSMSDLLDPGSWHLGEVRSAGWRLFIFQCLHVSIQPFVGIDSFKLSRKTFCEPSSFLFLWTCFCSVLLPQHVPHWPSYLRQRIE